VVDEIGVMVPVVVAGATVIDSVDVGVVDVVVVVVGMVVTSLGSEL
jgi:hypothetical protein